MNKSEYVYPLDYTITMEDYKKFKYDFLYERRQDLLEIQSLINEKGSFVNMEWNDRAILYNYLCMDVSKANSIGETLWYPDHIKVVLMFKSRNDALLWKLSRDS